MIKTPSDTELMQLQHDLEGVAESPALGEEAARHLRVLEQSWMWIPTTDRERQARRSTYRAARQFLVRDDLV